MNQPASDAPPDTGMSGPNISALPDDSSGAAPRTPASGIAPKRPAAGGNPFASLKQEKTVEAKVAGHLLDIAKGGALGGDTSVYHVPRELLEMSRRKKKVAADAPLKPAVALRPSPKMRQLAGYPPPRVRLSGATVRLSAPAGSLILSAIVGRSLRAWQRLGSLESRMFEGALLRGAVATVAWLALIYAAYRLLLG